MKTMRLFALTLGALICAHGHSQAGELPRESVESISHFTYKRLAEGRLPDGSLIGAARAKKIAYPVIPYDDRERAIISGNMSGFAEWCALDWRGTNFEPFMANLRKTRPQWSDEQVTFASMLHGISMQIAANSRKGQTCSDEFKNKLEKILARKKS